MTYAQNGNELNIKLLRDFNLLTARQLENLAKEAKIITVDLSNTKIVDSEAIVTIFRLLKAGKTIYLQHPPEILAEVIDILELGEVLNLEKMVIT